jgi:lipopolysaccharide/colanic/teichoic acid biosynthesis glycosyltransferase
MMKGRESARRPHVRWYESFKNVFEPGLAVVLFVLAAPIIMVCLVAVRLNSKGSPLYTQKRLGRRGRVITIYKIRTMYQDSERGLGATWSGPGDPRVTPIGRILRWAHLDELPQLVNVLRGEMSLVGPRPERPEIVAQLERVFPEYRDRLLVRPGLTGLAQVLQGPDTSLNSVQSKLRYDLFYVDNLGFWLDLRVTLGTVIYLLRVPDPIIARIFRFPLHDLAQTAATPEGERIAVSSRVQPNYVN